MFLVVFNQKTDYEVKNITSNILQKFDFPIEQLSNAIIKSSMIEYAINIYLGETKKMKDKPISAWFCPDILVAEETKKQVAEKKLNVELITAKTP